jgi:transcriptional regulator with GAF, ATPase, and Fis domain
LIWIESGGLERETHSGIGEGLLRNHICNWRRANSARLQNYDWPGNVRELENVVERAVIAARPGSLHFDIPEAAAESPNSSSSGAGDRAAEENVAVVPEREMRRRERENIAAALKLCREESNIAAALKLCKGRVYGPGGAAELLGVQPTTLSARIRKFGLK